MRRRILIPGHTGAHAQHRSHSRGSRKAGAMDIAIIGAGIAGLSAARVLADAGAKVTLFDKGRGPGGRLSSRRAETPLGDVSFDHGAQYFTARSDGFRALIDRLQAQGVVAPWDARFAEADASTGALTPVTTNDRMVGTPTMSRLVRALCDGLDVRFGMQVAGLSPSPSGWALSGSDGASLATANTVLLAIPPVQASALLSPCAAQLAASLGQPRLAPCWTVMLAFDVPMALSADAISIRAGALAWAARESSKPGRAPIEAWVLQASPEASVEDLAQPPEAVIRRLTAAFAGFAGPLPEPVFAQAHRWLYARVETPHPEPCLWDSQLRLGTAGDFHGGPRIEAAWLSGHALAARVLAG